MVDPAPSTSNCLQVSSMAMLSCTSLMVELASSCKGWQWRQGHEVERTPAGGVVGTRSPQTGTPNSAAANMQWCRQLPCHHPQQEALHSPQLHPSRTCPIFSMQLVSDWEKATADLRVATSACAGRHTRRPSSQHAMPCAQLKLTRPAKTNMHRMCTAQTCNPDRWIRPCSPAAPPACQGSPGTRLQQSNRAVNIGI